MPYNNVEEKNIFDHSGPTIPAGTILSFSPWRQSESKHRLAENRGTVVSAEFFNLPTPVVVLRVKSTAVKKEKRS